MAQSIDRKRIRKDGLAACGRGARKELGMPVADDRERLKNRGRGLNLDQYDNSSRHRDRRCSMHHNAERAVVGIAFERVHVRHLDHGQQRQQGKTHDCDQRQGAWLCASIAA